MKETNDIVINQDYPHKDMKVGQSSEISLDNRIEEMRMRSAIGSYASRKGWKYNIHKAKNSLSFTITRVK